MINVFKSTIPNQSKILALELQYNDDLRELSFECNEVVVLYRNGDKGQFQILYRLPLGQSTSIPMLTRDDRRIENMPVSVEEC